MKATSVKPIRCAIYTRVSTDHGLDQEFNSLNAQYDAASAYIKSQAHAGWSLIRSRYDDGGYSGGSTDRPDLQRLLDDIRARKIDVIVVYKVDRLTRSLADFAKLVELFDAQNVVMPPDLAHCFASNSSQIRPREGFVALRRRRARHIFVTRCCDLCVNSHNAHPGKTAYAIVIRHSCRADCLDRDRRVRDCRLRRRGQNPLQRAQGGLCLWRLCRQRHVAISRPALSLLDRRGELWLYLWRLSDRFRRHRQQHPKADVNGVYGAVGAGAAVVRGGGVILLTNQNGAVLELSGRQAGLIVAVDLNGLVISLW